MSLDDLRPLAEQNLPVVSFPGTTRLEQMLNGFQQAKGYILSLVPAGYTLNYDAAVMTAEQYASQVQERKAVVQQAFQTGTDLSEQDGLTAEQKNSREYWLSQYAIAAEGVGAYASGGMQQAVGQYPNWTQYDYEESIDHRIKVFSSIVSAGANGYLAPLITPEAYAQSTVANSPQGAMMLRSGQIPASVSGSIITVGSTGTKVAVPTLTGGASGLGIAPILVVAGVVAIIGIAVVAGVTIYYIQKKQMETSAALATEICRQAFESKNQSAIDACMKNAAEITKPKSLADTAIGGKIQDYLIWGGIALAGIYFAPLIVQSAIGVQGALVKKNRGRR